MRSKGIINYEVLYCEQTPVELVSLWPSIREAQPVHWPPQSPPLNLSVLGMMRVIVKVAHPYKQTVGGFVPVSLGLARVQEVSELSIPPRVLIRANHSFRLSFEKMSLIAKKNGWVHGQRRQLVIVTGISRRHKQKLSNKFWRPLLAWPGLLTFPDQFNSSLVKMLTCAFTRKVYPASVFPSRGNPTKISSSVTPNVVTVLICQSRFQSYFLLHYLTEWFPKATTVELQ